MHLTHKFTYSTLKPKVVTKKPLAPKVSSIIFPKSSSQVVIQPITYDSRCRSVTQQMMAALAVANRHAEVDRDQKDAEVEPMKNLWKTYEKPMKNQWNTKTYEKPMKHQWNTKTYEKPMKTNIWKNSELRTPEDSEGWAWRESMNQSSLRYFLLCLYSCFCLSTIWKAVGELV